MSNGLALAEFRSASQLNAEALAAFTDRDEREIALWMLAMRDKAFHDVELHLAFQAKTNGKCRSCDELAAIGKAAWP